jgi:hypothetical protein
MKYWIRLLLLVASIIGIIAAIGSVLPRSFDFSTSVTIAASPDKVYQLIDSTPDWEHWSHWNPEVIKNLQVEYAPDGKAQTWTDVRGSGKLWFVDQVENEKVSYKSLYANFPEMDSEIKIAATESGSQVSWSSRGDLPGGPYFGFLRSVFSNGMRMQYDQSLLKLKKLAEEN